MADLSSAPKVLRDFAERLSKGGAVLKTIRFLSPLNQVLQVETTIGVVQLLADRGQWFVDLAPPDQTSNDFFDAMTWRACLAREEAGTNADPLEEQVAWLEAYLRGEVSGTYTVQGLGETRRLLRGCPQCSGLTYRKSHTKKLLHNKVTSHLWDRWAVHHRAQGPTPESSVMTSLRSHHRTPRPYAAGLILCDIKGTRAAEAWWATRSPIGWSHGWP